jgi:hypothetical protein
MDVKVLQRRYAKCICILDYFVVTRMSRIKYYNTRIYCLLKVMISVFFLNYCL